MPNDAEPVKKWSAYGNFSEDDEQTHAAELFEEIRPYIERYELTRPDTKQLSSGHGSEWVDKVRNIAFRAEQWDALERHGFVFPSYDFNEPNYDVSSVGPVGPSVGVRPPVPPRWTLFGQSIGFPIGLSASVLSANQSWVKYYARNGFNVITFKTVRSRRWRVLPPPHWRVLRQFSGSLDPMEDRALVVEADDWVPGVGQDITSANSFGIPSSSPAIWQAQVSAALRSIASDQVLIVSVIGTQEIERSERALARDFARTAQLAEDALASIVELNLSNPNLITAVNRATRIPILCEDPELCRRIINQVREKLKTQTKLVVKLGLMPDGRLRDFIATNGHLVDGVSGINAVQRAVESSDGLPLFAERRRAGVSGSAIHNLTVNWVNELAALRTEHDLHFAILASGGVTDHKTFLNLYQAGADVVQSVTGAFANPFLARDISRQLASDEAVLRQRRSDGVDPLVRQAAKSGSSALYELSEEMKLSMDRIAGDVVKLRSKEYPLLEDDSSGRLRPAAKLILHGR